MKKIVSAILAMLTAFAVTLPASAMPLFNKNGRVLVLTYHKISENPAEWSAYCIPPQMFESDLKFLKQEGFEFMKASQLAEGVTRGKKIAVLTFDDGYDSDCKLAVPLLEKYGACATFFVFGAAIGTEGYLTAPQITEMAKKPCVEIGNHTDKLHAKNYSTLSIMYNDPKYRNEIVNDFKANALALKKLTGVEPTAISYPNGIYSREIDRYFKANGCRVSFSTQEISYRLSTDTPIGRKNRGYERKISDMVY